MTRRIAHAALLVALTLALAAAPAAFAARGGGKPSGGGGTGTISLVLLNSTDGLPHVGQEVTFNVSTSATTYPYVTLKCYVGGSMVYKVSNGMFSGSLGQDFMLASNSWTSGAADCTAYLQNWDSYAKHHTITNLASMSFHVYA